MIKLKTFHNGVSNRQKHDEQISQFFEFLENNGHTLIDIKSFSFGISAGNSDNLRTEIYYRENHTRKVIVEKMNKI